MKYILYCRKSSEDSDRQTQSIEDQKKVMQNIAANKGFTIVKTFEENQSAKCPGRPKFNEMLNYIHQGKADGILAWKLDRLARNPVDGGNIVWMLQQGVIQKIVTNDRNYYPSDNVLMMNVEFGMANQFILDLTKNVKRGLHSKCEKGWKPNVAPVGYLNELRDNTIINDPERFHLVRKMWDLMLTGCYTPEKVAKIAREEWGLTTLPRRKSGGVPMKRTTAYKVFKNTFYCGEFRYGGELFIGAHEPMITKAEYDRVQSILGRNGNPRQKTREFAYTGLLKCPECGCSVTAEEKTKYIKTKNEVKSYIYYHCTKKKGYCSQKSVEQRVLEAQVEEILNKIEISDNFMKWVRENLEKETGQLMKERKLVQKSLESELKIQAQRLDNLIKLKISAQNTDESLLSNEEYLAQKNEIVSYKNSLHQNLKDSDLRQNQYIDVTAMVFDFCKIAKEKFKNGTMEEKKLILKCLGSKFEVKNKNLVLELRKVFQIIEEQDISYPRKHGKLEPSESLYRRVIKAVKDDFVTSGGTLAHLLELFFEKINHNSEKKYD